MGVTVMLILLLQISELQKRIKKVSAPTTLKTVLQCHCSQQRRAMPESNIQSTCPILCVNQENGKEYSPGKRELCKCACSKSYYLEDVPKIKATLALVKHDDAKVLSSREEADSWIQRSNNAGKFAEEIAREVLSGNAPLASASHSSKLEYLQEFQDLAKPPHTASTVLKSRVINPLLHDPTRCLVICLDGEEVDLHM